MIKSTSLSVIATMLLTSQMANANQINSVQQSSSIIDKLKFITVISYIKNDFI